MTGSAAKHRFGRSDILAAFLSLAAVAAMAWRMLHGVDFRDEAFYLAMALRFALGDQPFVDDLCLGASGMLLYPVVKLFTLTTGGTTGLILFARTLYLLFFGLVGWSVYALAVRRLPRATALLLATACVCFLPYGIPGLSYNTLGMGFLTIGLFLSARWLLDPVPARTFVHAPLFWAGAAHGATAAAYPPLVLAVGATGLAIFALAPAGARVRSAWRYAAGGLACSLLFVPVLLAAGPANLHAVWAYSLLAQSGEAAPDLAARLPHLLRTFHWQQPQLLPAAGIILLAIPLARRWPMPTVLALPFIPLLARGSLMFTKECPGAGPCHGFISAFALLAPLLCLALRDRRAARVLALCVALPALVAAATTAWSSTNGILATALGGFPGAILGAVVLACFIDETAAPLSHPRLRTCLQFAPAVFAASLLLYALRPDAYYNDGPRAVLTARLTEGPYKGLYTSPARRQMLTELHADLRAHAHGPRALFYFEFPAGYLLAARRPLVTSAWTFNVTKRLERDARDFQTRAQPGEIVIRMGTATDTALDRAVAERCDLVAQRHEYAVFTVR